MEWLQARELLITAHIFGSIFGAGGAYMSDLIFLSSVRNKHISETEKRFIKMGGRMVWAGLALLII